MSIEVVKVSGISHLNKHIIECVLSCSDNVTAIPGQYILIRIDDAWRPFSVAEIREGKDIVLIVQLIDKTITADFFSAIKLGSELYIQEPQGEIIIPDERDVTFLATGTGLVPLYAVARHLLEGGYKHNVNIIFGVQSEDNLFYTDKLHNLEENYDNCKTIITVSKPSGLWRGRRGRVSHYLEENIDELRESTFYLCGRKQTVASLMQLLEGFNVPASRMNFIE